MSEHGILDTPITELWDSVESSHGSPPSFTFKEDTKVELLQPVAEFPTYEMKMTYVGITIDDWTPSNATIDFPHLKHLDMFQWSPLI